MRREGKDNVHFLVKWRGGIIILFLDGYVCTGTDETDFVNAKEAKAKIPQVSCLLLHNRCSIFSLDAGGDRLLRGEVGLVHWGGQPGGGIVVAPGLSEESCWEMVIYSFLGVSLPR